MLLRVLQRGKRELCVRYLTHYEALRIPRSATKADIKKAYLERAKDCHPDLNPDNEEASLQFQQIQEAHDVLMCSKARAQYNNRLQHERFYGYQETHGASDTSTRQSNVRREGMNNRYNGGRRNENYHENHRVNNDNYSYPGSQNTTYRTSSSDDQHFQWASAHGVMQNLYLIYIGVAAVGIFIFVQMVFVIKDQFYEGRHNKYRMIDNRKKAVQESLSNRKKAVQESLSRRFSTEPVRYTERYVFDSETEKAVKVQMTSAGKRAGDLKNKFHSAIQSSLGELDTEDEPEPAPEPAKKKKDITKLDISLLRIEMNTKKEAYLAAKRDYNDNLEEFNNNLKERRRDNVIPSRLRELRRRQE